MACKHTHEQCGGKNVQKVKSLASLMPVEEEVADLSELFKVLGDPTRIRILCALLNGELCVCDIAELLDYTQSAISHQVRALKQARLVKYRREGKTVFYAVSDDHVHTILSMGMEHISE